MFNPDIKIEVNEFTLIKGVSYVHLSGLVRKAGLESETVILTNGRGGEPRAVKLYDLAALEELLTVYRGPEVKIAILELYFLGWEPRKIAGILKVQKAYIIEVLEEWERSGGYLEIKSKI